MGSRVFPAGDPAVAALNLSPRPGRVAENLLLASNAVAEARRRERGLRWAVLPELCTTGYAHLGAVHRHAEHATRGRSARFFFSLARDLDLYLAYGFPERLPCGGMADSANLVGPEGVVLTYRKRNLVETLGEPAVFTPGWEAPVVEAGGLRVALLVCWDLGFPEAAREAAASGADLILAPAAWREPWGPQYDLSCAARALDSGLFVASANQRGEYPEARFAAPGHVYGPDGARISHESDAASVAHLDPAAITGWRTTYGGTLRDRADTPHEGVLEDVS